MANSEKAKRVLAKCRHCGSVTVAWTWPDGSIQIIGDKRCDCGEDEFDVIDSPL